jgi:hypothetical protein
MRPAAALPSVLLALALTSALAVGGAYVARQHAAMARVSQLGLELVVAAEAALVDAVIQWDSASFDALPVGQAVALPVASDSATRCEVWATRTGAGQFWLVAQASSRARPGFRRRAGLLVTTSSGEPQVLGPRGRMELP